MSHPSVVCTPPGRKLERSALMPDFQTQVLTILVEQVTPLRTVRPRPRGGGRRKVGIRVPRRWRGRVMSLPRGGQRDAELRGAVRLLVLRILSRKTNISSIVTFPGQWSVALVTVQRSQALCSLQSYGSAFTHTWLSGELFAR